MRWKFGVDRDSTVVIHNYFNSKFLIRNRPFFFTTNPEDIHICALAISILELSSTFKFRRSISVEDRPLSFWRHIQSKSLTNKQVRS